MLTLEKYGHKNLAVQIRSATQNDSWKSWDVVNETRIFKTENTEDDSTLYQLSFNIENSPKTIDDILTNAENLHSWCPPLVHSKALMTVNSCSDPEMISKVDGKC